MSGSLVLLISKWPPLSSSASRECHQNGILFPTYGLAGRGTVIWEWMNYTSVVWPRFGIVVDEWRFLISSLVNRLNSFLLVTYYRDLKYASQFACGIDFLEHEYIQSPFDAPINGWLSMYRTYMVIWVDIALESLVSIYFNIYERLKFQGVLIKWEHSNQSPKCNGFSYLSKLQICCCNLGKRTHILYVFYIILLTSFFNLEQQ